MHNDFPSKARVHVALGVADLDASLTFYQTLLQAKPTKTKPGYAKFELKDPSLHLALNLVPKAREWDGASHFGIQLKSTGEIMSEKVRLQNAGLKTRDEEQVTCCYSVQDKFWVTDPDGNEWELFTVLEDAAVHSAPSEGKAGVGPRQDCCEPTCCTPEAEAKQNAEDEACCEPTCCS